MQPSDFYFEGREAYEAGEPKSACPYHCPAGLSDYSELDAVEANHWLGGWEQAEYEHRYANGELVFICLEQVGIELTLSGYDVSTGRYAGGTVTSNLKVNPDDEDGEDWERSNLAVDVLESIVLAHACAGVDVKSRAYQEGLETALDAISSNIDPW